MEWIKMARKHWKPFIKKPFHKILWSRDKSSATGWKKYQVKIEKRGKRGKYKRHSYHRKEMSKRSKGYDKWNHLTKQDVMYQKICTEQLIANVLKEIFNEEESSRKES